MEGAGADSSSHPRPEPGELNQNHPEHVIPDVAVRDDAGRHGQPRQVTDEELVRALYSEHAGPLLRYALHLTSGDRQRAEDIVQETRTAGQAA